MLEIGSEELPPQDVTSAIAQVREFPASSVLPYCSNNSSRNIVHGLSNLHPSTDKKLLLVAA